MYEVFNWAVQGCAEEETGGPDILRHRNWNGKILCGKATEDVQQVISCGEYGYEPVSTTFIFVSICITNHYIYIDIHQ